MVCIVVYVPIALFVGTMVGMQCNTQTILCGQPNIQDFLLNSGVPLPFHLLHRVLPKTENALNTARVYTYSHIAVTLNPPRPNSRPPTPSCVPSEDLPIVAEALAILN